MIKSSRTTTKVSAVFLATVLLAGTIALSAPSFMTLATAQAQPYYGDGGMDNRYNSYGSAYDKRSYGNDYGYESQYQPSYKPDYKPAYPSYKPDYKPAYPSYDKKDNRDKSKDSNNVDIKKIKCNNININLNLGSGNATNGNGNDDNGNTHDKNLTKVKKFNKDGFTFICINNNNNVAGGGGNVTDGDRDGAVVDACVNCFNTELDATVRNAIAAELAEPGAESIQNVPGEGTVVIPESFTSIAALCAFLEDYPLSGQPDPAFAFDREQTEFILTDLAGGTVAPGTFDDLLDCLEDIGIIVA